MRFCISAGFSPFAPGSAKGSSCPAKALERSSTSASNVLTRPPRSSYERERQQHKTSMTTNTTNTVRLHRVLRAKPERVYRAFLDPDAMAKWLPPNGFTGKVHHLDAKVGGTYK